VRFCLDILNFKLNIAAVIATELQVASACPGRDGARGGLISLQVLVVFFWLSLLRCADSESGSLPSPPSKPRGRGSGGAEPFPRPATRQQHRAPAKHTDHQGATSGPLQRHSPSVSTPLARSFLTWAAPQPHVPPQALPMQAGRAAGSAGLTQHQARDPIRRCRPHQWH